MLRLVDFESAANSFITGEPIRVYINPDMVVAIMEGAKDDEFIIELSSVPSMVLKGSAEQAKERLTRLDG